MVITDFQAGDALTLGRTLTVPVATALTEVRLVITSRPGYSEADALLVALATLAGTPDGLIAESGIGNRQARFCLALSGAQTALLRGQRLFAYTLSFRLSSGQALAPESGFLCPLLGLLGRAERGAP